MTTIAANVVANATSKVAAAGYEMLIYMPCLGAATLNNPGAQGLLSTPDCQGKAAEGALVACMRKLIVILNTMIARDQKWDPSRYAVA